MLNPSQARPSKNSDRPDISVVRSLLLPLPRAIGFVMLGLLFAWLILTRTLAAGLAERSPETALLLQPGEPTANLALASSGLRTLLEATKGIAEPATNDPSVDRLGQLSRLAELALLNKENMGSTAGTEKPDTPPPNTPEPKQDARPAAPPAADVQKVRGWATRAIANAPLNGDALVILGQLEENSGSPQRTEAIMRSAARLSRRTSYAVYWLMQKAETEGNHAAVLETADTLLRTRGGSASLAVPALARLAEKDGRDAVIDLLKRAPPWRDAFFRQLPRSITDVRTPLYLLQALQTSPNPATKMELAGYLRFLLASKYHELAYYTWLQFMTPEELATVSPLYNASFEKAPSGLPFDWTLPTGSGYVSEIRPVPEREDEHALFIEFTQGRAEYKSIGQSTLLGPGTYTLKGQHRGGLISKRGLRWRVTCLGQKTLLAEGDLIRGDIVEWREFGFTFTVPPTGCRAQQVQLDLDARSASENLISGSIWFDKLEIKRAG